jgi:DNA repair exonuclease SbcCD nuclease subunit
MAFKMLCIGDVHLGRLPSRIPETLRKETLSSAAALRSAVEYAVNSEVDAVIFAGDLVDSDKCRFEVLPVLADAVRTLSEAGIKTVAVAGNHDVEALPRLKDLVGDFLIIGSGGTWEEITLQGKDATTVKILGWSFPRRSSGSYRNNPLTLLDKKEFTGPVIGIIHADMDTENSSYAPVRRTELEAVPVSAWLLGHIHKPDRLDTMRRPVGYLGSLCGLDPGEPGQHGAWLAEVDAGGSVQMTLIPLAPLRWEKLEIDVSSIDAYNIDDTADALIRLIKNKMTDFCRGKEAELDHLKSIGFRISLTGRTPASAYIQPALRTIGTDAATSKTDTVVLFSEKIINNTLPALNIAEIAKGKDAAAIIARKITALEQQTPEADEIIKDAVRKLPERIPAALRPFAMNMLEEREKLRSILIESAYAALDALYRQN